MKNSIIALLAVAVIALGAYTLHQRHQFQSQLARTEERLARARDQVQARSASDERAALAEQKAKVLQATLAESSAATAQQFQQVTQLEQSLAAAKTNATGSGLGALLKDPQMREMIKSQQKAVMGTIVEQQYAAMFRQLNLTPEQTASVKELLEKKMLVASDMGISMMDGSMDAAQRKEMAAQIKQETDRYEDQIRQLLGDDQYAAVKEYETSLPDRLAVGQIRDQLAGTGAALSAAQEEQLMQAMRDLRTGFKWSFDYSNAGGENVDFTEMFREDRLNQFAQEKERFDREFLERAKQYLSAEQLAALEKAQTTQREMQVNAMKLAGKMLAPKSQ